ncbi:MAG: glucose-1-phosphate adenylyltransferase [Syntrophomonadaceae bacterium]|nr:glucose-1-phosphate adenylyltransferase [Syntrophomonadaceae bacterium]
MVDLKKVLTVVLAGGEGSRLSPLTVQRAKPAVPFGGKYRIIDFTLSNCINSGIRRIMVLTQYKSHSLERHIRSSWGFLSGCLGEYIYAIPPQQRVNKNWYLGTADAIYQNLYSISMANPTYVIILAGDHIYKMDYRYMLNFHIRSGAEITIGTIEVDKSEAPNFGVIEVDAESGITNFLEKPQDPAVLNRLPQKILVSMGIYIFHIDSLIKWVERDAALPESEHDFGKNVIPQMLAAGRRVYAYQFREPDSAEPPYWRDVGTLDAYYEANMDLVSVVPSLNLYDPEWPFITFQDQVPPSKFLFSEGDTGRIGMAVDSIICDGCIISGGKVFHSVLSPNVRVNSFTEVRDSVLMSGVQVGRNSRIRRAVIDKNVRIAPNTEIGFDLEKDAERFTVSEGGIIFIPKGTVVEAGIDQELE